MKRLLSPAGLLFGLFLLLAGCNRDIPITAGKSVYQTQAVIIADQGNYYKVTLDFTQGLNHREMGAELARGILEVIPDYEALVDSYIAEEVSRSLYNRIFWRVEDIKPQLNQDYVAEIEGMAGVFSGGDHNVRGDHKLSRDELYLFNLFLDAVRFSQCSFVSVFGSRSATDKTITGRNLDWYGGNRNQLPRIQAVITIKNLQGSICSIGYLGFIGIITGFNDSKVFAGIQESQTGLPYSSTGKRSYTLDLRYALENKKTLDDTAAYLQDPQKSYAVNHLIVLSDPTVSKVLENNIYGAGSTEARVRRALRTSDSRLNIGISWGFNDAIACVNSFLLYGNRDNHTINDYNIRRWKYIKEQLSIRKDVLTPEDIKSIMSYCKGSPSAFTDTKYLYNKATLYSVIFEPDTFALEVYFFPRNTLNAPSKPVFERISVFQ